MKKCYIVGAGDFFGSIDPCEDDLVIAADGGLGHLEKIGVIPDVIVGDFDSLGEEAEKYVPSAPSSAFSCEPSGEKSCVCICGKEIEVYRFPVMKDETDTYLAYRIGAARGYSFFEVYGGVGGREDHTFANYCLLLRAKNDKNDMILFGKGTETFVIKNERKMLVGEPGATVSVFAFGGSAEGVTIKDLKYEAQNVTLTPDRPLGVSNSFTALGEGEISVESGALLVTVFDR